MLLSNELSHFVTKQKTDINLDLSFTAPNGSTSLKHLPGQDPFGGKKTAFFKPYCVNK